MYLIVFSQATTTIVMIMTYSAAVAMVRNAKPYRSENSMFSVGKGIYSTSGFCLLIVVIVVVVIVFVIIVLSRLDECRSDVVPLFCAA